jgi:hypothetical protein
MANITNRFDGIVGRTELENGSHVLNATIFMTQKIKYVITEEEKKVGFHHLSKDDLKALIKEAELLINIIEKNED